MARILFVHNGSSGRFVFLANALRARGHDCMGINPPDGTDLPGVPTRKWQTVQRRSRDLFRPVVRVEADFLRGRLSADEAMALKNEGFVPDLIIGHPGWGEMMFLREVFPDARQIQIGEFYYRTHGGDVNFDAEFGMLDFDGQIDLHARNAALALSYTEADWIVCPTPFQASTIPQGLASRIRIIHEGVDLSRARAQPDAWIRFGDGTQMKVGDPVITFVNRRFEPIRGFHVFMRALPAFLEASPNAHVLIIGADDPNVYGRRAPKGESWKSLLLKEVGSRIDGKRVHFLGAVSYEDLIGVLSISSAHVYFTYPFVLSWSLIDAMATECLIVGSDTAPVRDVIRHGENGLLTNFFDTDALASVLASACATPEAYRHLRTAARRTAIEEYDRATICEPAWLSLVDETLASERA